MRIQIQVDAEEFWPSLQDDIRTAKEYVYVQALSFEGDRVGKALSQAMTDARVPDRRIIADEFYTKHCINDKFLYNPKHWFNSDVRRDRKETLQMIEALESREVRVKLANPSGPLLVRFLARNHKKNIVVDGRVAYIGGMNFSEHNFEWHDMMLRIEDGKVARFLKDDFLSTWDGHHVNSSGKFHDVEIYTFDGRANETSFEPILQLIGSARRSIYVESPYVTLPFHEKLRQARRNGATVTVITPGENNWKFMKEYVLWESARAGIDVRLFRDRMTHLKGMLIDDEYLIVGSSNFDLLSYRFMQEIVAVITDQEAISQFKEEVIMKDVMRSMPSNVTANEPRGRYHHIGLKALDMLLWSIGRAYGNGMTTGAASPGPMTRAPT